MNGVSADRERWEWFAELHERCGSYEVFKRIDEFVADKVDDLARDVVALQAEVVRLRQALEGLAATPKHVPRTEEAACLQIEVASIARDALGSK